MNKIVLFGVALFLAAVGIALMGSDNRAVAGHGCHGCNGVSCDGGCGGYDDCCGRRHHRHRRCDGGCNGGCRGGLFSRHRNRCCGEVNACCGEAAPACCAVAAGPMQGPSKDYAAGPTQGPSKEAPAPAQAPSKEAPAQAPAQAPVKEAPAQAPAQAPAK